MNQAVFEESGTLVPTSQTWIEAQALANLNNGILARNGVYAAVTEIHVDPETQTVTVAVSANLNRLFPSVVPAVIVTEIGSSGIQAFSR